jgi:hypothetical protein
MIGIIRCFDEYRQIVPGALKTKEGRFALNLIDADSFSLKCGVIGSSRKNRLMCIVTQIFYVACKIGDRVIDWRCQ